jgi:penicillin-binding protein 1A
MGTEHLNACRFIVSRVVFPTILRGWIMSNDSNLPSSQKGIRGLRGVAIPYIHADEPHRSLRRRLIRHVIEIVVLALCIVPLPLLIWAFYDLRLPSPDALTAQPVIAVQAADGQPIFGQGQFKLPAVPVKDIPPNVVNAVLSIEDRGFYQHGGIDLTSMVRAFVDNLRAGKIVAGGSTITQQLVKMRFLGPQRTYRRKVEEAALSIWLQFRLSKDQILTSYLNSVYLGSGASGFPAAAKLYFNKNISDLTLSEAAMLAGMISAPTQDDPLLNIEAARSRAATVLDAMVTNGKLTPQDALAAKLNPATPAPTEISSPSAGWFADWIHDQAAKAVPDLNRAIEVRTTLDMQLQNLAAKILRSTLAAYGPEMRATQAALVAMRPDGAVVAMVGGLNYNESKFNRAVQAKRQPGSAFKLFDYYAALRQGFSPNDEILDEPVDIKGWEPDNYARHYHGRVTLADAFAHSLNAATVRLSQQVGIAQVIAAARELGLRAPLKNDPSLALGTSEVSLLDLTSAYAAVRAGMAPAEPWGIVSVNMSGDSRPIQVGKPNERQHSLGDYQSELIDLLQGVIAHGTGRAAALSGFAAGKTGTSQNYRDAWFIGFNDSLVVGVWVGNDNHSPMRGVVGGSLPALIWKQFMEQGGPIAAAVAAQQTSPATSPAAGQQANTTATGAGEQSPGTNGLVDQSAPATASQAAGGKCDISVCERHYHSFRAEDCTYQPYRGGPRRYCGRGQGDVASGTSSPDVDEHRSQPAPLYVFGPLIGSEHSGR